QPNKEHNLAPNASAQHQALNLIKEAESKVNKYEKLKDSCVIIEKEKKHLSSLKRHAVSQAKLQEKK
ncbi:36650_t:CDS:2, partial [Gigaspora margarita]